MDEKTPTVEDIERRQRLLSILFKIFFALLILIACVFVGWIISYLGYHAWNAPADSETPLLTAQMMPLLLR